MSLNQLARQRWLNQTMLYVLQTLPDSIAMPEALAPLMRAYFMKPDAMAQSVLLGAGTGYSEALSFVEDMFSLGPPVLNKELEDKFRVWARNPNLARALEAALRTGVQNATLRDLGVDVRSTEAFLSWRQTEDGLRKALLYETVALYILEFMRDLVPDLMVTQDQISWSITKEQVKEELFVRLVQNRTHEDVALAQSIFDDMPFDSRYPQWAHEVIGRLEADWLPQDRAIMKVARALQLMGAGAKNIPSEVDDIVPVIRKAFVNTMHARAADIVTDARNVVQRALDEALRAIINRAERALGSAKGAWDLMLLGASPEMLLKIEAWQPSAQLHAAIVAVAIELQQAADTIELIRETAVGAVEEAYDQDGDWTENSLAVRPPAGSAASFRRKAKEAFDDLDKLRGSLMRGPVRSRLAKRPPMRPSFIRGTTGRIDVPFGSQDPLTFSFELDEEIELPVNARWTFLIHGVKLVLAEGEQNGRFLGYEFTPHSMDFADERRETVEEAIRKEAQKKVEQGQNKKMVDAYLEKKLDNFSFFGGFTREDSEGDLQLEVTDQKGQTFISAAYQIRIVGVPTWPGPPQPKMASLPGRNGRLIFPNTVSSGEAQRAVSSGRAVGSLQQPPPQWTSGLFDYVAQQQDYYTPVPLYRSIDNMLLSVISGQPPLGYHPYSFMRSLDFQIEMLLRAGMTIQEVLALPDDDQPPEDAIQEEFLRRFQAERDLSAYEDRVSVIGKGLLPHMGPDFDPTAPIKVGFYAMRLFYDQASAMGPAALEGVGPFEAPPAPPAVPEIRAVGPSSATLENLFNSVTRSLPPPSVVSEGADAPPQSRPIVSTTPADAPPQTEPDVSEPNLTEGVSDEDEGEDGDEDEEGANVPPPPQSIVERRQALVAPPKPVADVSGKGAEGESEPESQVVMDVTEPPAEKSSVEPTPTPRRSGRATTQVAPRSSLTSTPAQEAADAPAQQKPVSVKEKRQKVAKRGRGRRTGKKTKGKVRR